MKRFFSNLLSKLQPKRALNIVEGLEMVFLILAIFVPVLSIIFYMANNMPYFIGCWAVAAFSFVGALFVSSLEF